ncbi:hypothetical protein, partial [Kitasatospora sp. NPDC086791]|uniref:hypothetical protein n=1 Tax=Kitasatospora sp. NPDC086791 TaxID=3155178 RepID=UPI0034295B9E
TFGTLLSSQGTDASFGPPSSGPSGLASFVFPAYQMFSAPFSGVSFHPIPAGGISCELRPEAYQSLDALSSRDLLRQRARIS